jgi:hypothetical protein
MIAKLLDSHHENTEANHPFYSVNHAQEIFGRGDSTQGCNAGRVLAGFGVEFSTKLANVRSFMIDNGQHPAEEK